jgi:murein DD-endopeptidase MepM/ murein hydrolase activator NlpD
MCASRRLAIWPQLVAISLIGIGVAGCSADSGRFNQGFSSSNPPSARSDVTGSIPQTAPSSRIESRPLPHLAAADDGSSGGGRGMGSFQPAGTEVTGSIVAAPPPPPSWTWEGGTPIVVGPGETLESIARRHAVPVAALVQANNLSSPAAVYPGQHLVIPRYRSGAPDTRMASTAPAMPAPVGPPRSALVAPSGTHVVAPGETLNSIARLYGKPVMVIARANNLPPDTMVKVGERLVIPEMREAPRTVTANPATVAPRAEAPAPPTTSSVASIESPHSARLASPAEAPATTDNSVKTAEPAGGLPSFRWPVRGRIIAAFGPKPNGLQNDGINLAVPEGTPIKAAEDGVVAYAGNELKGYGNLVLVRHANGFVTAYANASDILVKRGDPVKRGEVIAHSGQSGNVTSPQLHFEIRKGATPVDPSQYLNGA